MCVSVNVSVILDYLKVISLILIFNSSISDGDIEGGNIIAYVIVVVC